MRRTGIIVFGTLLLLIALGIAYIFNGAGTNRPIAGMFMTPFLIPVFALPVALLLIVSVVMRKRNR